MKKSNNLPPQGWEPISSNNHMAIHLGLPASVVGMSMNRAITASEHAMCINMGRGGNSAVMDMLIQKHLSTPHKMFVKESLEVVNRLMYPTGYKDGNKLGMRKRNMLKRTVVMEGDTLKCSPEYVDGLVKDIGKGTIIAIDELAYLQSIDHSEFDSTMKIRRKK